jgi:CCR4-NOT transcription complex subunit 7/8
MYSQASIESLQQAGIDFPALERDGIDPFDFGALLISSGMVCDEDIKWISFHGGYDFGYLTKLMICQPLLDDEVEFEALMKKFFPSIYDVKYLTKQCVQLHASGQLTPADAATLEILQKFEQKPSLENLAEALKVKRQGPAHQGGSDALLTGKVFFQMRERLWNGEIPDEHLSKVWGLGNPDSGNAQAYNAAYGAGAQEGDAQGQNGSYTDGVPSTPNNTHANMVTTPAPTTNSSTGVGSMTPGGGGGVFGAFQFGK